MAEAARQEDWPRTVEEFEIWHAPAGALGTHPRTTADDGSGLGDSHDHQDERRAELRTALAERGCTVMVVGAQILSAEISAIPDVVVTCSPIDHRPR